MHDIRFARRIFATPMRFDGKIDGGLKKAGHSPFLSGQGLQRNAGFSDATEITLAH
jgi:hypothetical protein